MILEAPAKNPAMEPHTKPSRLLGPHGVAGAAGVLTFLVYAATLWFQFVYDDLGQIVDNPAIRSWRFLPQYFNSHAWAGKEVGTNYYRPLNLLWFRLNYALFGLNAPGWHLAVILLHVAGTILVFHLIKRLLADWKIAALSALIFGLHPIHVQSVAWVSGTADPLTAIFLIGGFLAYLNSGSRCKVTWLSVSLLSYAAAMFTKEPGVVLPLLILAHELILPPRNVEKGTLNSRLGSALLAILPFVAVAMIYFAARIHALHGFAPASSTMSASQIVLTWPAILWLYVRHLFLPWGYSLFYDLRPVQHLFSRAFLVPATGLVLTAAILWLLRRFLKLSPAVVRTSAIWFFIPLLPALYLRAIDPEIFGQDRYLYLSCVGFSIFLSAVIRNIPSSLPNRAKPSRLELYTGVSVLGIFACCTLVQEQFWANNVALFRRAITIAPENNQALNNLAVALADRNEFDSALEIFERAVTRNPESARLNYNYAYTLYRMGRWQKALSFFARAIELDPTNSDAFLYMGMSHFKLGYLQDAVTEIRRAVVMNPSRRGAHLAMGAVLQAEGNLAGAIEETRTELNNYPEDDAVRQRLAGLQRQAESSGKQPLT